ncbi:type VI secretion system secreted protein Hcp [Humibacillus xanthopallidus]|uniref:Type VI secretion system secreted protein Hcp n=1 Tax=Humibacillus xanthopallidus TaxID=412689 RepID=A0A543PMH5_9MICO|nr:type VI secretion system tube protein Hcp [Humibacillus xanthopallidus]TQN45266.1 type VI secretion system secreted protein Hcp [Humibacillus xanthopallidus]
MSDSPPTFQATRRNLLKGGAVGLGALGGGIALSGVSSSAAAAADSLTGSSVTALSGGGTANYFLNIDGIPGESKDSDHPDWIDVLDFSWGASAAAAITSGPGAMSGKATVTDLRVSTWLSQASPKLFLGVMSGKHMKTAVLEGVKPIEQESPALFLRLSLEDVLVTAYSSKAGDEAPQDEFSLAFAKISYSYWMQQADGNMGPEQVIRWDIKANKAV